MSDTAEKTALAGKSRAGYLAFVCLVASLAGLLFGFDTAVISGTIESVKKQFALTELMEGWFTSSALVGCILGAATAGLLGDRFGRKPSLIISAALFLMSGLGSTFPPTFGVLVAARLACGLGIGIASAVTPMYISEFAPPKRRGRFVACYQLSIVIGILLAYLSNWVILRFAQGYSAAGGSNHLLGWILVREHWRGMFGAEVLPAALFLGLLLLVPESPRWLIKSGRQSAGLEVLSRISGPRVAQREMEEIQRGLHQQESSFSELLRPGLRTALLVGVMLSVFGQLSGVNIVVYYGPKILMAAGYGDAGALLGQVGFGLINLLFTVVAMLVIDSWGRRPLLIGGMAAVAFALAVIGVLFAISESALAGPAGGVSKTVGLWIGVMICFYIACIALSICAVIWVLTPEIFPNRVRSSAMSIATAANWSTNAFSALVFPWYAARFGLHTFFFTTAGICLASTLFFLRYVPETKGRTLEEIEQLWLPRS
jgi:SP family arabinose:H+ symporter-like MFS transporter